MTKTLSTPKDPHPIDKHVGVRLRLRRTMLKMSQETLASLVGVTFQQVQKYESGSNRISASRLYLISTVLEVPISFFFESFEGDEKVFKNADYTAAVAEDGSSTDPMQRTESLALIRAFWKISDTETREKVLSLVLAMSGTSPKEEN